jgi:hypothetical protein
MGGIPVFPYSHAFVRGENHVNGMEALELREEALG